MSKSGPNCCNANNVDRNNEVYVLQDTGRFAYHYWGNELQGEEAPLAVAVPKARSKTYGGEGRNQTEDMVGNRDETKAKIQEQKAEQKRLQEQKKAEQKAAAEEKKRADAEKKAAEKAAAEEKKRADAEKKAAEKAAAEEKKKADKAAAEEKKRADAERKAAEKAAAEEKKKADAEKKAAEKAAADEQKAAEKAAAEEKKKADAEKKAAEKAAADQEKAAKKAAADQEKAAKKAAADEEKAAKKAAAEEKKKATEKEPAEEQNQAEPEQVVEEKAGDDDQKQAEAEKKAAEKAAAEEAKKAEKERKAAEKAAAAEAKKAEQERKAAEKKAAQEKKAAEKKAAQEKKAAEEAAAKEQPPAEEEAPEAAQEEPAPVQEEPAPAQEEAPVDNTKQQKADAAAAKKAEKEAAAAKKKQEKEAAAKKKAEEKAAAAAKKAEQKKAAEEAKAEKKRQAAEKKAATEAAKQVQAEEPLEESKFQFYRGYKRPEDLVNFDEFFEPTTTSLCKKCLTPEIWEEYKDQKCAEGVSFKMCVFSGIANQDSGIGVYAGSHDAYYTFYKLFDQVVEEYHGHKPEDKHVSDMTADGFENAEFTAAQEAMVNSTRIRVGRNLAGYPLGPGVSKAQRLEIMDKVVKACNTFEGDLQGTFYPLDGMNKEVQQKLIEDHFLFKEGDRFLDACGLNRDWPSGRGIFHNDAKTFLVWVNEEDQLRIISMQPGANIAQVFERLCRAAKHIETVCEFSHDDHLGYITSCPTNLGTAMRASVHIKLPKLMQDKETMKAIADKYEVQIRGIHGEHTETDDGVYDISNRRRLGKSEKELVQDMINGVKALMQAEESL